MPDLINAVELDSDEALLLEGMLFALLFAIQKNMDKALAAMLSAELIASQMGFKKVLELQAKLASQRKH